MDWGPWGNSRLWTGTQALREVALGQPLPADHQAGQRRVPYTSSPRPIHPDDWYKQHSVTAVWKKSTKNQKKTKHLSAFAWYLLSLYLSSSKLYSDKNGNLLKTGDIVKFKKLADTLEKIANDGADAFYTGKIAEDLIRDIQEAGIVRWVSSCSLFQPLLYFCLAQWSNYKWTNLFSL